MAESFEGIDEKLKRAKENIVNLHGEIKAFFDNCEYPTLPDHNDKVLFKKAAEYHYKLVIPTRFSVLAGEIVHHHRSCLDHVVWHFSSPEYRLEKPRNIQFPIFEKPLAKDNIGGFLGNIKGITDPFVENLIRDLQPYKRGGVSDPLFIVHDMDRIDKHRELKIVRPAAMLNVPAGTPWEIVERIQAYSQGKTFSRKELLELSDYLKQNVKPSSGIVFSDIGQGQSQPVIPLLAYLHNHVVAVINKFRPYVS